MDEVDIQKRVQTYLIPHCELEKIPEEQSAMLRMSAIGSPCFQQGRRLFQSLSLNQEAYLLIVGVAGWGTVRWSALMPVT